MPWLVDGDNLLGTWRRERTDLERRSVARQVARFAASHRRQAVIVFDGQAPAGLAFGPEVRWAGVGRSADDVILDLLRVQRDVRGWTVVTEDRSLGDRCRHLGARLERCSAFRARLCAGGGEEKPEREDDVEGWLHEFGGGDPV
jgi:hypothetical protein